MMSERTCPPAAGTKALAYRPHEGARKLRQKPLAGDGAKSSLLRRLWRPKGPEREKKKGRDEGADGPKAHYKSFTRILPVIRCRAQGLAPPTCCPRGRLGRMEIPTGRTAIERVLIVARDSDDKEP